MGNRGRGTNVLELDPGEKFDLVMRPVLQPLRLLSLGDSYAAGEGTERANRHRCARSDWNYAGRVVQDRLYDVTNTPGLDSYEMRNLVDQDPRVHMATGSGSEWAFVACTSGVSRNIWSGPYENVKDPWDGDDDNIDSIIEPDAQYENPPRPPDAVTQLDSFATSAARIESPNAVTITMGGNDAGFVPLITECYTGRIAVLLTDGDAPLSNWLASKVSAADIDSIRGRECEVGFANMGGANPLNPARSSVDNFLTEVIGPRMEHTYQQISEAVARDGEQAPVVTVFGYPTLFTDGCGYSDLLGAHNVAWLDEAVGKINATLAEEAERAGFAFLRPSEFDGHAICDSDTYLNGLVVNFVDASNDVDAIGDFDLLLGDSEVLLSNIVGQEIEKNRSIHPNTAGWNAYQRGWVRINQDQGRRNAAGLLLPRFFPNSQLSASMVAEASFQVEAEIPSRSDAVVTAEAPVICGRQGFVAGDNVDVSIEQADPGVASVGILGMDGSEIATADVAIGADGAASVSLPIPSGISENVLLVVTEPGEGQFPFLAFEIVAISSTDVGLCAGDDAVAVNHSSTSVSIDVLANDATDIKPLDPGSITIQSEPTSGNAAVIAGQIRYTPDPWLRTVDGFTYSVCEVGGRCSTADVEVDFTVGCTIVADGRHVVSGTDGDDVICGSPRPERIETGSGNDVVYTGGGQDVVNMIDSTGVLHSDPFPFQLDVSTGTVVIGDPDLEAVTVVDAAATNARDDEGIVVEGTLESRPLTNDRFATGPDLASFEVVSVGFGLTVTDVSTETGDVVLSVQTDGQNGEQTLAYRVCDLGGSCDEATIRINTDDMEPSSPPNAVDDESAALVDEMVVIDVLANDSDPDGDLNPGSLELTTIPAGVEAVVVVVDGDPLIEIVAGSDAQSPATVIYVVCDDLDNCDQANVVLTIISQTDCTITGTEGADVLRGTSGPDVICALGGADEIRGRGGDDIIFGGAGKDTIFAGAGNDQVHAGRGADIVEGGNGDDIIRGGRGNDRLLGQSGSDQIRGGRGKDFVSGGSGTDYLYGGPGADELRGGNQSDVLRGRAGADSLFGERGADTLFGGRGADELRGGSGNDELYGRRGQDLLIGGSGNDIGRGGRGFDQCRTIEDPRSCR